jgi:hypothetical protein
MKEGTKWNGKGWERKGNILPAFFPYLLSWLAPPLLSLPVFLPAFFPLFNFFSFYQFSISPPFCLSSLPDPIRLHQKEHKLGQGNIKVSQGTFFILPFFLLFLFLSCCLLFLLRSFDVCAHSKSFSP